MAHRHLGKTASAWLLFAVLGSGSVGAGEPVPLAAPQPGRAAGFFELELAASGATPGDQAGSAVAANGHSVVVAASPAAGAGHGWLNVFRDASRGLWTRVEGARFVVAGTTPGDGLGSVLALAGRTVLVGVAQADGGAGAAWLARDTSATGDWSQTAEVRLTSPQPRPGAHFGGAVALCGRLAVIGAPLDPGAGPRSGAAWVVRDTSPAGDWSTTAVTLIRAGGVNADDGYGAAVATDGRSIVVGAPLKDIYNRSGGAAYVVRDQSAKGDFSGWAVTRLEPSGILAFQAVGRAVAVSGRLAVVGGRGAVWLFRDRSAEGDWRKLEQTRLTPPGVGESFGAAVATDGRVVVIGEPDADRAGMLSGAVWLVEDSGAAGDFSRTAVVDVTPRAVAPFDHAGRALAMVGDTVVIGAPGHDRPGVADSGTAFVLFQTLFADGFDAGSAAAWIRGTAPGPTPTPPAAKKH